MYTPVASRVQLRFHAPLFCQYTDPQDIENIQYVTFLLMARAGLRALEFYDPVNKKHGQAHMQAR